jgi:predicted Rossmann fold flavoprotein
VPDSGSTNSLPVVIIGGGAAGMFAAITCAEANPHRRIIVLEKGTSLLAKVRISGGGRCNVTHACFDPKQLVKNYPRGSRELLGPFHRWQPRDTVAWFESRGVSLKTEEDGRMFPVTDSSQTIVDCLLNSAQRAGVEVRLGVGLVAARPTSSGGFELELSDDRSLVCSRLLIAGGGLKPGPLVEMIKSFGHTITPLAPSLFTFHVRDPRIDGLMGLSVPQAEASIPGTKFAHQGPLLITHWGLSGPAILKLSAWAACWAQERDYRFTVRLNWSGASEQDARAAIESARKNFAGRQVRKASLLELPTRLWERLVSAAGIPDLMPWSQLRREQASALVTQLTACDLPVTGKSMFKEEFVTSGGVALKEIDFKTMSSRLVPGLHFAGEVLDIDGVTGGFNFQAAWTGGRLAGLAMAET